MKKGILSALALAVCVVLPDAALAADIQDRYLITYFSSATTAAIRSATVVTVVNQSSTDVCRVVVLWFLDEDFSEPSFRGSSELTLKPGASGHFCSRDLNPFLTVCSGLTPGITGGWTPTQGKAVVSSTANNACSLLAVDARVYYTTGDNDAAIAAITNPKVVFLGEGNLGD